MRDSHQGAAREGRGCWRWEDYVKDVSWFARCCNLPDDGILPSAIPNRVVTPAMLDTVFERKTEGGYKLTRCTLIPQHDIRHLLEILEGQRTSLYYVSSIFAKGLYADRVLGMRVNWAIWAHIRHKHQLQAAMRRGRPAPAGPPLLRHAMTYEQPPKLVFNLAQDEEGGAQRLRVGVDLQPPNEDAMPGEEADERREPLMVGVPSSVQDYASSGSPDSEGTEEVIERESYDHYPAMVAEASLFSFLTPNSIKQEIGRLVEIQEQIQVDVSILRIILHLVSNRGTKRRREMKGEVPRRCRPSDEDCEIYDREKRSSHRVQEYSRRMENENEQELGSAMMRAANDEVEDMTDSSGRKYRDVKETRGREYEVRVTTKDKDERARVHLCPSAAELVQTLLSRVLGASDHLLNHGKYNP